jgi:LPS sulfotransferase NodH
VTASRLVLVVGCPRSGTTWLGQLLMSHPAATGIREGETSLFLCLQDLYANMRRTDGTGLSNDVDEEALDAAVRRFCDRMIGAAVRRDDPGAQVFVEKTPAHAFMLARIAHLYPDVAVMHIVRDGRDVARSLAELSFGAPSVRAGAQAWVRTLTAVEQQAGALRAFRQVRYEGLLEDPLGGVSELFEWLGLPVDADVRARVRAEAGRRVSKFDTSGPVGSGKWRSLRAGDLADVYLVAGDRLVQHGYVTGAQLARARRTWPSVVARARALGRTLGRLPPAKRAASRGARWFTLGSDHASE